MCPQSNMHVTVRNCASIHRNMVFEISTGPLSQLTPKRTGYTEASKSSTLIINQGRSKSALKTSKLNQTSFPQPIFQIRAYTHPNFIDPVIKSHTSKLPNRAKKRNPGRRNEEQVKNLKAGDFDESLATT